MLDIPANELRSAVVVVKHCKSTIGQGVVEVASPDVEGEDGVDEGEEQAVQHLEQRRAQALAVVEALGAMIDVIRLLDRWKIGLEELFALCRRQLLTRLRIFVSPKARELALGRHFSTAGTGCRWGVD